MLDAFACTFILGCEPCLIFYRLCGDLVESGGAHHHIHWHASSESLQSDGRKGHSRQAIFSASSPNLTQLCLRLTINVALCRAPYEQSLANPEACNMILLHPSLRPFSICLQRMLGGPTPSVGRSDAIPSSTHTILEHLSPLSVSPLPQPHSLPCLRPH